jgi:hypothetical protein
VYAGGLALPLTSEANMAQEEVTYPGALAYSYIRFSSGEQRDGNSVPRQTKDAANWARQNGVPLDRSTTLHDLGRSAFRGKHRQNPDRNALAAFLDMVERGMVPPGSFLIVESLDRLTREDIQPALLLVVGLLQAGIRIVQLKPREIIYDHKSDPPTIMLMIVELMRGNGESQRKSGLGESTWEDKRAAARADLSVQTARVPAWIRVVGRERVGRHVRGGRFEIPADRLALGGRIFDLCINGWGVSRIVRQLTAEGIPAWGRTKRWTVAYVHQRILTNREACGEYQPRRRGRPEGPPIPDYFPQLVPVPHFERAQLALASRKEQRGRTGRAVASLFTRLITDAATGERFLIANQTRGRGKHRQQRRILVPIRSKEFCSGVRSFPNDYFEAAVLSLLRELNPAEVWGAEPDSEADRLAAELAQVDARTRQIEDELTTGDEEVAGLARALRSLAGRRQELARAVAAARAREAHPVSGAWAESRTLMDAAQDEAGRLRLRALLRRYIDDAWALIVIPTAHPTHRLCALQVQFKEGQRRDYLIHYWSAGFHREGGWEACSADWSHDATKGGHAYDLRNRAEAAAVEALLAASHYATPSRSGRPD